MDLTDDVVTFFLLLVFRVACTSICSNEIAGSSLGTLHNVGALTGLTVILVGLDGVMLGSGRSSSCSVGGGGRRSSLAMAEARGGGGGVGGGGGGGEWGGGRSRSPLMLGGGVGKEMLS